MVNFLGIMQNEWAGAQAFSSFDTYLAPFVKVDNLTQKEVKQCVQSFIYGVNTPSRWGTQAPFSNVTLDWTVPNDLKNLSGATEATVTIEITGLETRVFDVDKNDVQFHWIGLPENMDVDILSDMIKICLRGEKTYLDAVTPQDIVIEADLSSLIENAAGGYQTVVVSVTVPSIPEVGAIRDQGEPEYELVFRLVEKKVEETA